MTAPIVLPWLDHFAARSEPRRNAKIWYPLPEILLLVLSATLAGADDFVEVTPWGTELDWLSSHRRYRGEPVFPDLAMIGRIEPEVERNGKIEYERRHYLCSLALCAVTFARAARSHRAVENHLHWILDVVFHEDLARSRTANGPENMAITRHAAVNPLSRAKPTIGTKNRRKRAGWSVDYPEKLIRQTA